MSNQITILNDRSVPVSFDTKGYTFFQGARGLLGSPVEAHLRLFAVRGSERIEVQNIDDLRARVEISNPEEALEFVRLFTSVETGYLFPDVEYVEARPVDHDPGLAEYTREHAQRMKLQPVVARTEGDAFVIERNVVDRKGRLLRLTERVGKDGSYSIIKTTVIDEHSPVIYPIYE